MRHSAPASLSAFSGQHDEIDVNAHVNFFVSGLPFRSVQIFCPYFPLMPDNSDNKVTMLPCAEF